MAYNALMCR